MTTFEDIAKTALDLNAKFTFCQISLGCEQICRPLDSALAAGKTVSILLKVVFVLRLLVDFGNHALLVHLLYLLCAIVRFLSLIDRLIEGRLVVLA